MNPVIYSLYRRQRAEAARNAALIRMDLAADTGYLNPQLSTAYLSGVTPGAPDPMVGPVPAVPPAGIPMSDPVLQQAAPQAGLTVPDVILTAAVNATIPGSQLSPEELLYEAELRRRALIRKSMADTQRAMLNATRPPVMTPEQQARANALYMLNLQMAEDYARSQNQYMP